MRESATTGEENGLLALSRRSRRAAEHGDDADRVDGAGADVTDEATAEMAAADDASAADTTADEATAEIASTEAAGTRHRSKRRRFRTWRRQRPFIGGVLAGLGGIELFFSGQLDTGNLHIQFGIEGLQATVIPIAILVLGLCAIFRPTHHIFYGIIALVLAVYSLIGVNLGGFLLGMLLSTIGAILIVAWMGPREPDADYDSGADAGSDAERRQDSNSTGEGTTA
jgi:hypothetical protein